MDTDPVHHIMVQSACDIGHAMGKQVVVKHIVSDELLSAARDIGVDYVQGAAIAEPRLISPLK